jgi:cohesin loading factor subunit SCC2
LTSLIKLSDTKQKAGQFRYEKLEAYINGGLRIDFRLRDGRSIRTVSALLLQLIQTSAHGVRLQARRLAKERQQCLAMRRQESTNDKASQPFLDDKDEQVGARPVLLSFNLKRCHKEIRLYMSGLESATKAAKTIVIFLTQR